MKRSREVDAWFETYEHPEKDAMLFVRDVLLGADPRMEECIKWKTPTFTFGGNLASFNPQTKKHVSLMFHTGAKIPGRFARLEGGGDTARYMRIADLTDAKRAKKELEAIVRAWCAMKAPEGEAAVKKKAPAKKKKAPAKKKAPGKKKGPPVKEPPAKKPPKKDPPKKKPPKKDPPKKAPPKKLPGRKKVPMKV